MKAITTKPKKEGLTVEEFKLALPDHLRKNVNVQLLHSINQKLTGDEDLHEEFRNNLIGYTSVLKEGKYRLDAYADAVKFCTFRFMGNTQDEAYAKTFPDRYNRLLAKGLNKKGISSYASMYAKGKLVNLIMEQSMIATHIYNQDVFQEAINHQFYLMKNADSQKVQQDAADSLMTHLAPPKDNKVELDVNVKESSAVTELKEAVARLASETATAIKEKKTTAHAAAEAKLIQGEVVNE